MTLSEETELSVTKPINVELFSHCYQAKLYIYNIHDTCITYLCKYVI